jgi:hypothetical protein
MSPQTRKTRYNTSQYSKTRKARLSPPSRTAAATVAPETKQVVINSNYTPVNDERYIPIPSYTPAILPQYAPDSYDCFYYRIRQTESNDTFIATVRTRGIGDTEIIVGGSVKSLPKECVKIIIQKDRDAGNDIVEAIFLVDYRQHCNEANDLKSAIILARVAVSFAYTYFRIDKFVLKDHSMFYCYTPTRTYEYSLAGRYLLKYGETWYQRNLNARIYHPRTLESIKKYLNFIETKPDFGIFQTAPTPMRTDQLKQIWANTPNYREMVLKILDEIQRTTDLDTDTDTDTNQNQNCHLLYPWFNRISNEYLHDLLYADNFILRDGFLFIEGLTVEYLGTDNTLHVENTSSLKTFIKNHTNMKKMGGGGRNPKRWFVKRD